MKFCRGYTVLEVLVSLSLSTVLLIAVGQVFNSAQDIFNTNNHQLSLRTELRRALLQISQEIREGSPDHAIQISDGQIQIEVAPDWTPVTYSLNGGNQLVRTVNGQSRVVGNNVQAFVPTYNAATDPRSVFIRITGQRATAKPRNITETIAAQITLRN
ncbi:MAG TPA: hypothetical protein PKL97_03790 [Candidatus Omnitrophota bacterium]|nr:hypothetical protein [Candidatus Omnitrophota bacterium]